MHTESTGEMEHQQDPERMLTTAWYGSSVEFHNHLNVTEIHSHIRKYLTTAESETLISTNVPWGQKINELINFFPKKGGGWFDNFMDALTKTKAGTGHDIIITALNSKLPKGNTISCTIYRLANCIIYGVMSCHPKLVLPDHLWQFFLP